MAGLIVVIPVLLQRFAQRHTSGDEQQIGGKDHKDHRREEQQHGLHRLLNGHRHDVGHCQQHRPQHRHENIGLRRFFAVVLTAQQRHGAAAAHLHQRAQQDQQEDGQIEKRLLQQSAAVDREGKVHSGAHGGTQAQLHRKGQPHTGGQSHHQRNGGGEQRLQRAQQGDVPLAQTQYMVQAELPLPPPDQEGIGVKQEQQREHRNDPCAETQNHPGAAAALHALQQRAVPQLAHHIVHGHRTHAGEDIGQVQPLILADAVPRKPCVQAHCRSPPVVSAVSASEIRW